jgi:hypothetical protein
MMTRVVSPSENGEKRFTRTSTPRDHNAYQSKLGHKTAQSF